MLTKSDLQKIGSVVDDRLETKLEKKLEPIKKDLTDVKKDIKYLRKKVNKIDKTVSVLVERSDREETLLKQRVKRIEEHLDLPRNNN
ncbi:MAG: hypothetical protein HY427_02110 [Candidatus Levybacteria bacterium]|nr:hypothetical protein [Candidatus Levybacteria bacterium]